MSHAGTIIEEDQSPGIIRIITTGHAFLQNTREVIFRKPVNGTSPVAAQERFILFWTDPISGFNYGDPVKFNLTSIEHWKILNPHLEIELNMHIMELKKKIPLKWKAGFDFKYIANKVEPLPLDFVLYPFFNLIRDLKKDNIENVIDELGDIQNHEFERPILSKMNGEDLSVYRIKMLSSSKFDREVHGPVVVSPKDSEKLDKLRRILEQGVHDMSSAGQVPCRLGRG